MTSASNVAFGVALVLYLGAMLLLFHHLAFRRRSSWLAGTSLATVGVTVHLTSVVLRGAAAGRVPWGNMYEYASVVGLLVVAGALVIERVAGVRGPTGFAIGVAVLGMGAATMLYVPPGPLVPALNSYWLRIHVLAAMIGSSLFILGTVFTVLYLIRERSERRATPPPAPVPAMAAVGVGGLPEDYAEGADAVDSGPGRPREPRRSRLPAAAVLDRLAYRTIAFAFPVWTFAVIAGAIWAEEAWGRYWAWDPKEVWAFVTWALFASYLHARATVGWRGRKAAFLVLLGFGALVFNLIVVNLAVSSLHGYAGV